MGWTHAVGHNDEKPEIAEDGNAAVSLSSNHSMVAYILTA